MSEADMLASIVGCILGLFILHVFSRMIGTGSGAFDWLGALADWVADKLGAAPRRDRR